MRYAKRFMKIFQEYKVKEEIIPEYGQKMLSEIKG